MCLYNFSAFIFESSQQKYLLYACIQKSNSLKKYSLTTETKSFDLLGNIFILKARVDLSELETIQKDISMGQLSGAYFDNIDVSIIDKRLFTQIGKDSSDNLTRFKNNLPESLSTYTEKVEVYYTESQEALLDYIESLSSTQLIVFKTELLRFIEKNIQLKL